MIIANLLFFLQDIEECWLYFRFSYIRVWISGQHTPD